jgi:hypothetical protein
MQRILRNLVFVSMGAGAALIVGVASAQQEPTIDPMPESDPGSIYTGEEQPAPFGGAADAGMGGAADAGLGGAADAGMGGAGDAGVMIFEEEYGPNVE